METYPLYFRRINMKYSVRGNMAMSDGSAVVEVLNGYTLWRLHTSQSNVDGTDYFNFEAWVNTIADRDSLFNELKIYVDAYGESIDWHECTHDEEVQQPCVIIEEYRG
jgi:hypothetical protein